LEERVLTPFSGQVYGGSVDCALLNKSNSTIIPKLIGINNLSFTRPCQTQSCWWDVVRPKGMGTWSGALDGLTPCRS